MATSGPKQNHTYAEKSSSGGLQRESDMESESAIATEFDSTTQTSVNTISARLSVETLNSDQKLDDFNSVCVKIETDEWYNTAADFYSAFAKSEQVLGEMMHLDCNKQNGFNLVLEQTGCLQMEQDYTKQDAFNSECVKSEQKECEVMHQDVTRQACVNSVCVNKNMTANSNECTAQDEPHSVFGKAKQSLNLNTDQSYITTNDLDYVCGIAKHYINTDTDSGNTTANNHNALCYQTYSKTPDNQAKLADLNSVFLTREEIKLAIVDQYCARPTVGGAKINMDHYSNPNDPRHSNSKKEDSENVVTRKPAKMKSKEKGDRMKTVKIMKKAKTLETDKTEYSLQGRNLASCMNPEPPDNDHFLYCGECNKEFEGDCPVHGPYNYIQDKEIYKDGKASHFVDAQNQATYNWMRYVNCAMTQADRNLVALLYKGFIYYCTLKPVLPGEELLVWYSDEFAREFGPYQRQELVQLFQ